MGTAVYRLVASSHPMDSESTSLPGTATFSERALADFSVPPTALGGPSFSEIAKVTA
jgi:hypothetical protein